jgi:hypothetical protein
MSGSAGDLEPRDPTLPAPRLEAPSADVQADAPSSALPGEHRGGFQREMTAPVPVTEPVRVPTEVASEPAGSLPRSAPWAMLFAVLGLGVSLLVGWGFLIGCVGVGLAITALRRPWERRGVAVWALCLSLLSLAYSAGWLWWASTQGPLFG